QLLCLNAIVWRHGNADAAPHDEAVTGNVIWFSEGFLDSHCQISDIRRLLDGGLNNTEFVASQARKSIQVSDTVLQPARTCLQQFVAAQMPERIVNELEVIEVEVEHRKMLASTNPLERLVKLHTELRAICQIG